MKKAFTIIRVSGRDQLKGNGPDAQWEDDVLPNAPVLELEVNEEYRRVIQESASGWNRPKFEAAVNEAIECHKSGEIQAVLAGLKAVEADSAQVDHFAQTLADVEARLKELEEEQKQLLKQSLMGFPEELVIKENQKINGDRAVLLQRKAELEDKIEQSQQATVDMDNIKLVCDIVSKSLGSLTYEDKRLAIEALDIKVWINHNELTMEGSIPIPDDLSNLSVISRCSG